MPRPCAAETGIGSPSPRPWNSAARCASSTRSTLLATTITGMLERRSRSASSSSPGRTPARASTTKHGDRGLGQRGARLLADRAGDRVGVERVHAAGVDQRELAPVPLAGELLAVARDAGALVHDRLAAAAEPVDEARLADVRVADDGDLHAAHRTPSPPPARGVVNATMRSTTSGRVRPVVSSGIASGAGASGDVSRPRSRASRVLLLGEHRRRRRGRSARAAPRALLRRRRRGRP